MRISSPSFVSLLSPIAWAMARTADYSGFRDGGSRGGRGGLLDLAFPPVQWVHAYPVIGIPVMILSAIFLIYVYLRGSNAYRSSVLRRGGIVIAMRQQSANIQQLVA